MRSASGRLRSRSSFTTKKTWAIGRFLGGTGGRRAPAVILLRARTARASRGGRSALTGQQLAGAVDVEGVLHQEPRPRFGPRARLQQLDGLGPPGAVVREDRLRQ